MSDLISRKALLQALYKAEEECEEAMTAPTFATALYAIKNQPTAYDPDKVVGELEELKKLEEGEGNNGYCPDGNGMCRYMFDSIGCSYCAFEKAIEIVRKGGVE